MNHGAPHVSIGLPVYNGERYLAQSIDSILAQTYRDFELIISDNCSTDATEEICRAYAARDPRIRYYRNERNLGPTWNFNHTFELARGEYFKWGSHDDVCAPELLERCVAALDSMPDVVLAYARMTLIDDNSQVIERYDEVQRTYLERPHQRFYELNRTAHRCPQMFGVFRSSILGMTPLIGNYTSSDVTLLAWLGLLGRFYEVPEYLFFCRYHQHHSMHLSRHQRAQWAEPANVGRIVFPEWRLFYELIHCALTAPVPWPERARCALYMMCWPAWDPHWKRLGNDLAIALRQILAPSVMRLTRGKRALRQGSSVGR